MARGFRLSARWSWVALCGAFAALSVLSWALTLPHEALDWQPALVWREPWRWWSAAFVHLSAWHLAANLAGCAVVAAFGAAARLPPRAAIAWLAAWPLGHFSLLVLPELERYAGLSGVLHAGVAVAALHLVWLDTGRARTIGSLVLAGLAVKLLLESPWGPPLRVSPEWDFAVAPLAHTTGALAGLVCGAVACATSGGGRHGTIAR